MLRLLVCLLLLLTGLPLTAQQVLYGNYSIDGRFCAGPECWNNEDFANATVKLKNSEIRLLIEDTSLSSFPSNDWRIEANGALPSDNYFAIFDHDRNRALLTLTAGAPANALFLDGTGNLGLGTSIPQARLHLVDSLAPGIIFQATDSNQSWHLNTTPAGVVLQDRESGAIPFVIGEGAPANAFSLRPDGKLGLGTNAPSTALHLRRTDGSAAIRVENAAPSTASVREMFNMTNNGGSYFTLTNTSSGRSWYFAHEHNPQGRFMINHSNGGIQMSLTPQGDLTVMGRFISGNTRLNVPDYVFEESYPLRPLSEVRAFIDANSHLPDVPSATDIARDGLDVTEMQLTLLKKVEELTLYTLEQERLISDQQRTLSEAQAQMAALVARLEQLEGKP